MASRANLIGQRFGKLLVTKFIDTYTRPMGKGKMSYWLCLCDCGNEHAVCIEDLRRGHTSSCGCARRKYNEPAAMDMYGYHKHRAKRAHRAFTLTVDEFRSLTSQSCHYCGTPPSNVYTSRHWGEKFVYSGIDRVNSDGGYTLDNCVSCCEICNKAKNALTIEQFNSWIYQLAVHQNLISKSRDIW